ncbi:related to 54S ribosomal protein L12, mitochondrial [Saccharomycodes ludwigii]|uniref:Related to 54S ribosomal protein L12, mitochondrial n=1 Tax=Saccharomycodes ludwigii TaxID=36035 RepID=A0A376B5G7_9ASCO|nr:hypothetical protein SCDLUD_001101 [Saccharomycodes ludwigii]KAH3903461.1 hypothetical protein SCDLUD_001101 [Saccharomycodes ludwigii]SSD59903.1 related to 54S ribosomal protein L12, mitochondrial [Saccharomycodes ludwigii]
MLAQRQITSKLPLLAKSVTTHSVSITSFKRFNQTVSNSDPVPVDPKISKIVNDISSLTLLETSSLIQELKSKLNIPDISFPTAGAAVPSANAATPQAAAEEEAPKEEKTIFSVKLESFDAKTKAKVIKEVKTLLGLSLVEAKKFVEAAPKILKENVSKEDAEKVKKTLEGFGAKVTLE